MTSRIGARTGHGHSLHQPGLKPSVRRSLTRLNNSRALIAQQEQALDVSRIRVIDGDTFAYGAERIRVQAFNAPERSDAGGWEATRRFEQLLHEGHVITMVPKATDVYGRTVADVFVDHRNIADLLNYSGNSTP